MSDDLKPCPYCGAEHVGSCCSSYDGKWFGNLGCVVCGATFEVENQPDQATLEAALAKLWNARAIAQEGLELLKEAPCTCTEPNGIGIVDHSETNPACFQNRAKLYQLKP
jgi:hypothetical protein